MRRSPHLFSYVFRGLDQPFGSGIFPRSQPQIWRIWGGKTVQSPSPIADETPNRLVQAISESFTGGDQWNQVDPQHKWPCLFNVGRLMNFVINCYINRWNTTGFKGISGGLVESSLWFAAFKKNLVILTSKALVNDFERYLWHLMAELHVRICKILILLYYLILMTPFGFHELVYQLRTAIEIPGLPWTARCPYFAFTKVESFQQQLVLSLQAKSQHRLERFEAIEARRQDHSAKRKNCVSVVCLKTDPWWSLFTLW